MSSRNNKNRGSHVPLVNLTPKEVRRLVKPHPGFDEFAAELVDLFEDCPEHLGTGGIKAGLILDDIDIAEMLTARSAKLAQEQALIDKTRLFHASRAWMQMLLIYGRARQAARTNAAVARRIERFQRFMRSGPRKKKVPRSAS